MREDGERKQSSLPTERFKELLNGYVKTKELEDLDSYIVVQSLDDKQGIMGALKLGMMELERQG